MVINTDNTLTLKQYKQKMKWSMQRKKNKKHEQ